MRILHTADWHLGKNLEGNSRMDEQEAFLLDFVDMVKENKIDLVMIAGDVYDTHNPPARAERMFYDTLKKLSGEGERLTLVIAGNHDNPERLIAAGPLAREHGIIMAGTPKTMIETGEYGKHKVIRSGQGFIEIEINKEKAVVLTVPYPSEKRLGEVLYGAMDEEKERLTSYGDRIQLLFNSLSKNFREDTINLVISHLFAMGSEESGSEKNVQLGGSFIINGSCFPKEAQYIALGHIHKPQVVPGTDKKARYAGSPLHYNKKEIGFEKQCFIVDIEAGKEPEIEEVKFKIYKPIEIWKCKNIDEAIEKCKENKDKDCFVYLEIKTDRFIREDEIKEMKTFKKDILEIVPIITTDDDHEIDVRSFHERPIEDIFRDFYFKERKVQPEQEVVDVLLSILNEEDENIETN